MIDLAINIFICLTGLGLHFAMKWDAYRTTAAPVGPLAYLMVTPAKAMIGALATVGAFAVMQQLEWMNPGMAFACGYAGDSIAKNLVAKFEKVP